MSAPITVEAAFVAGFIACYESGLDMQTDEGTARNVARDAYDVWLGEQRQALVHETQQTTKRRRVR